MRIVPIVLLLWIAALVECADSERMGNFRMAILYKNGAQTSCMAGLITMEAAFVAANCLDYSTERTIDASVTYEVNIYTIDTNIGLTVPVATSQISVHPDYNTSTLENNIAILQFNNGTSDSYFSYIAAKSFPSQENVYIRSTIDSSTNEWSAPVVSNQAIDSSNCAAGSGLYASNSGWLACTSTTTTSANNSNCAIPYGLIYAQLSNNTIVMSAIYSHSVVYGDSMCGGNATILNYYTNLWPFVPFAVEILWQEIPEYGNGETQDISDTTINSMNPPSSVDLSGAVTVGGDLYAVQKEMVDGTFNYSAPDSSSDSESSESADTSSSGEVHSSNADADANGRDGDGLSKGQKIAIGVTVPFVVVFIAVSAVLIYNTWKAKLQDKAWDPINETRELQLAAAELSLDEILATPPPYNNNSNEAQARNTSASSQHAAHKNFTKKVHL